MMRAKNGGESIPSLERSVDSAASTAAQLSRLGLTIAPHPRHHRIMNNTRLACVVIALAIQSVAQASPSTDALGNCLSDSTTGKDRKDLAKWIFASMSAHPEIASIARVGTEATETAQRSVGVLFTRLISESCANEMRAVVKAHSAEGVKAPFEHLGNIAMEELISNQQVNAVIAGFERYLDKAKVEPIVKPQ